MYVELAQTGARLYNLWQQNKDAKAAQKAHRRRLLQTRALAAEQLAITYNSIMSKSLETAQVARRQAFEIAVRTRQAEGAAVVQQAAGGVAGKRADLARNMAIRGGSERVMTTLEIDHKRAQDALIDRADMEERATVNRLISNTPDAPADFSAANVLNFISGAISDWSDYKRAETGEQELIES